MAAIFDDDGFLVILLHVRQRLGQDAGLIERTDMRHVGHETGLVVSGVGRFLSDWRPRRKVLLLPPAAPMPPPPRARASSRSEACRLTARQKGTGCGRHIAAASNRRRTMLLRPQSQMP